ncbi:MAG: HemK/PrmC family methyltransferase, partial [Steroidobacteraceae bacterium]
MTTAIASLIEQGAARLAPLTDRSRHEAELLLGAALGRSRASLLANPEERIIDRTATDRYAAWLDRRAQGEPVAYLLGEKEFWSLTLEVTPDVLIPRPATELAVERSLLHLPRDGAAYVLDVATGSGAIALALAQERPQARLLGTDVSPAALQVARR